MQIVGKDWGREIWIINDKYCGKILELKGGWSCSTHYHGRKQETFYCLEGEVTLIYGGETFNLKAGDNPVTIYPGGHHSFSSRKPAKILEVSTKHDDNDVYRIEKSHKLKTYCFDLDGVACTNTEGYYSEAEPIEETIKKINSLHNKGHTIIINTARGSTTGLDWKEVTEKQLKIWGVQYDKLVMGKPCADYYIDDKCINIKDWSIDD